MGMGMGVGGGGGEGVEGGGLLEGQVALGEGEVVVRGEVPLVGAELHLGVGGVARPGLGPVGDRQGEARGVPRPLHENGRLPFRVLHHRQLQLQARMPRRHWAEVALAGGGGGGGLGIYLGRGRDEQG